MGGQVKIRAAVTADLDGIMAVENASFDADRFSRRQFSYLISHAKGAFYVAESNGRVVGYLSLLQRNRAANLRIYSVAVDPGARGLGVGQAFICKSREYALANGFRQISLEVRPDNRAAIGLYRKNGFTATALLRGYYNDGSDAIRMRAVLL